MEESARPSRSFLVRTIWIFFSLYVIISILPNLWQRFVGVFCYNVVATNRWQHVHVSGYWWGLIPRTTSCSLLFISYMKWSISLLPRRCPFRKEAEISEGTCVTTRILQKVSIHRGYITGPCFPASYKLHTVGCHRSSIPVTKHLSQTDMVFRFVWHSCFCGWINIMQGGWHADQRCDLQIAFANAACCFLQCFWTFG